MINIAATARCSFTLPADLVTTAAYFRDLERTLQDLPHLSLVQTHGPGQYRILYSAAEGGVYHVALYCDIQVQFDETTQTICVTPATGIPPVLPRVTINSLTGQGCYSSRAVLRSAGPRTSVTYDVETKAQLPKPRGLALVPDQVVKRAIEAVVQQRLQDYTDAFTLRARP